jgi:hypothetical protein
MKNKKILILLLVILPFAVQSQLHVGIRGGYSISSVAFIPSYKQHSLYDWPFDAGIVFKYFDLEYFGFQGEINVTQRGYRLPLSDENTLDDIKHYKRISTYAEIPLFMQIRAKYNNIFIHFNAGVTASYMINSYHGSDTSGVYHMQKYEMNILRDNSFDYGLMGGLGIGYDFKFGTIQVEARYHYGLGDLYYHKFEGNPMRSPMRLQNISFTYLYNISSLFEKRKEAKQIIGKNQDTNIEKK